MSVQAHRTSRCQVSGYTEAAKWHPRFMVQVLAQELAKKGITVNAIIPTTISGRGRFYGHCRRRTNETLGGTV